MRRSKRFLSMILVLLLCLSMLPVSALALELPELDVLEDVVAAVEEVEAAESGEFVEVEEPAGEEPEETDTDTTESVSVEEAADVLYAANAYTINGVTVKYTDYSSSPDECWAYANNFYNKIWGSNFTNSFSDTNNSLRNLSDSDLTLTEAHLKTIGGNCVEPATTVYTCEVCGDSYSEMADNNWSEWSTTYPSGVDSDAIESRVEYRYKVKEHTTSTSSSLSGWDLEDEVSEWGDYGAWSSWSTTKATASDSKQVETRTAYHYYYYKCASCGAHMHGYGTNACYTWAGGCGGTISSGSYTKGYYTTPYSSAKDWHGTGVYYITDSSAGKVFAYTSSSSSHYVAPVTQYRYRTRALETTYYFYRWGNWSDWSATYVAASDDTKVETRTVYRYDLYSMAEHDWDSGVVTTPAGPGTSGVKTYTCNVCGETKTESIAALPNEYTVTYNANGGTGATAAQTKTHGEDLTLSTTKPTRSGYTFLGWSTVKTAEIAMFEPGKTYSLADKDLVLYAVWEHSDHSYMESITKQPTCTSTGIKTYTCSVCGDSYEETLNATGHKTELRNAAEATCAKGGYTGDLVCTVCGKTTAYGQEVAATGHAIVTDDAVEPTCTKTGMTEGKHCSVCGTVTVAQKTVAKIAHAWDSGKVTKEPVLNMDGVLTYTCTACGGTKTEKISAISVDINSDGTSNAFDLVALMKHIVGVETAKNMDALDVNGDSKVDILDVVRLVRYLADDDMN